MANYAEIKKLDMESEKKMILDYEGPAHECICHILAPPEKPTIGGAVRKSIKRAMRSVSGASKKIGGDTGKKAAKGAAKTAADAKKNISLTALGGKFKIDAGGPGLTLPLTTEKGKGGIYTTKEKVKRDKPCGKCPCDKENLVMKHAYANIKLITPDISTICPCPEDCFPDADKLNDISVTIERLEVIQRNPDLTDSEASVSSVPPSPEEPTMERRAVMELIEAQYNASEKDRGMPEQDDISEWSFDDKKETHTE